MKNHYKVLRIPDYSNKDAIKKAYLDLVKIYHPDVNNGNVFFNDYFIEIKNAYDFLIDENNKLKFDDLLLNNPELFSSLDIQPIGLDNQRVFQSSKVQIKFIIFSFLAFALGICTYYLIHKNELSVFGAGNIESKRDSSSISDLDYNDENSRQYNQNSDLKVNSSSELSNSSYIGTADDPLKNKTYNDENNLNYENQMRQSRQQNVSSKKNWQDKVSAEVNGSSLLIINKNSFDIFRVNLTITYRDDDKWMELDNFMDPMFSREEHPFTREEYKSWFNIRPGVTSLIYGDSKLKWVRVESCELQ